MAQNLSRSLAGVIIFCVLAGITSGFITASSFMPDYSLCYNLRQWYPGSQAVLVLGRVANHEESRVIQVSGWDELREAGMPASRLWLFDAKTTQEPTFALVSHGIWRQNRLRLRDDLTLDFDYGPVTVPVAGVWHPFHPQLGDNWVVLVGDGDISVTTGTVPETLPPVQKGMLLPPNYQGRNLLSWMLINTLGYLLYGAIGLASTKGRCAAIGWGVKLWAGGGIAVLVGLVSSALVFRAFLPLPMLGLLPMTLGMLAASYLVAALLLSCLCIIVSRIA